MSGSLLGLCLKRGNQGIEARAALMSQIINLSLSRRSYPNMAVGCENELFLRQTSRRCLVAGSQRLIQAVQLNAGWTGRFRRW